MAVVVLSPAEPVLELALVKKHLRVEHADDDDLIEAYMAAAQAAIDGPAGWLGRSIGEQLLELRRDCFDSPLALPYGPVTEITGIDYVDTAGAEQTLDDGLYVLLADGRLDLAYGESWPSVRGDVEGVRIAYAAGYAADAVPAAIIAALLLMIGDLYANRETAVVGTISAAVQMSTTVEALLAPYRVWMP